jgi:hypothetical protein
MYVTVPSSVVQKLTHTLLQLEHPEKYSLTEKPAKIKVHLNELHSRVLAAKAAQMLGGMGPGLQILAFGSLGYPPMQPYGYLPYPYHQPCPMPIWWAHLERSLQLKLSRTLSIRSLAGWLSIGKGTADLIIRYAEQDIQLVKAGKFQLLPSESST